MKILQLGKAKSGNFWAYKIIQDILKEAGIVQKKFITKTNEYKGIQNTELSTIEQNEKDVIDIENHGIYYRVSSIFKTEIKDFDQYLDKVTHVWSHSKISNKSDYVINKFDKVIYIIRDPRDVMLSHSNFVLTKYMKKYYPNRWKSSEQFVKYNLISSSLGWLDHVAPYLQRNYKNMYVLFYERLLLNFEEELNNLLDFLELELSFEAKNRIAQDAIAENMIKGNPNHVHKPYIYKWKKRLSTKQNKIFIKYCSKTLSSLNYDLDICEYHKIPFLSENNLFENKRHDFDYFLERIKRKTFNFINSLL